MLPRSACAVALTLAVALMIRPTPAGAQPTPGTEGPGTAPAPIVPPTPDRPVATMPGAPEPAPVKLRWRDTWLIWDNAVTTQTVGVGKNYLSADPTYVMTGSFRPRYYLYDGEDQEAIYLAGRVDVVHEFTNSDVTTRRGETTLSDAVLLAGYRRMLAKSPGYETIGTIRLPILTFPTSKFSMDNGTITGLGTELRLSQSMPLAGDKWSVFKTITLGAITGYNHTFTVATTPTNPDLRYVRMDPLGRAIPGDQLAGAAFPEHELSLSAYLIADITDKLSMFVEASYRPTWKYPFSTAPICNVQSSGVVATQSSACIAPLLPPSPNTYVPISGFDAYVDYTPIDQLSIDVGYVNLAPQPGLDGQRRTLFYSPGAQFYLSVIGHLDSIYLGATGKKAEASGATTRLRP
jgi:hypothetical protein